MANILMDIKDTVVNPVSKGIAKDIIISVLRKLKNTVKPINEEYIKNSENKPITIEIHKFYLCQSILMLFL